MAAILKLKNHDKRKEIEFELKYLKSLSIKERFKLMFKKTKEMIGLLEKSGHRRPSQIIKRAIKNETRRSKTPGYRRPQIPKKIKKK